MIADRVLERGAREDLIRARLAAGKLSPDILGPRDAAARVGIAFGDR